MSVQSSIVVQAPASVVFDIVADPRQHARIDGSGTVLGDADGPDRLALGDTFGMGMRLGVGYRTRNTVVEHEPDRLIAWRHVGLHRWRYELEELPAEDAHDAQDAGGPRCRVTETWDDSRYPAAGRLALRLLGYPSKNLRAIEETLRRLRDAAEQDARRGEEDA
ncbi:SRPBCC family protein [Nocardioides sp. GY 10127]|uniref:SRPBCC family protein n=1 Tax=Nocardioides sp. GY 10127 TaxID=2569762 RepID=UPI0010A8D32B|nr:SRPBCC family protein [Nocardioides sp. GY 10127]TIC82905.1 dimethyladenosine transferase [Nocardioides sp. GY 10127]